MRVLHVATRHRRGGAERNLAHTIGWEQQQGFEVHLAVGVDHIEAELPIGAVIHVIPDLVRAVAPVRDLRAFLALRRLVRQQRFDIVHTHQSKAGVIGRLAARGQVPVVLHTIHMASFGTAYSGVASRLFQLAERLCAPFTTRIISVGRELATMYRAAGIGRLEQYVVIRSPIDLVGLEQVRSMSAAERQGARARFRLRAGVPVAIVLSSLEPRKRVDLVLRTLQARMSGGGIQVLVGGDGPERQNLEQLAQDLGIASHVVFAGHIENVAVAFAASDVLVHAATVEGVPQVVVQALAAGVPVAATEMIGLREVDGGPVEIAPGSGRDLDKAVERALIRLRGQVPMSSLDQWSPESVSGSLGRLYSTLPSHP